MNHLQKDLDHVLLHTKSLWSEVRGKTIFITGGTGFFGRWLLHSFIYANSSLNLNNRLIVLTRNQGSFLEKNPEFGNLNDVSFLNGDVRNFAFPEGAVDYIIHAATDAKESLNQDEPMLMYDTIVDGTKRILELARVKNTIAVLHTSSGAVYGKQPSEITHVPESYNGCPDILAANAAYGEGKRVAEMMAAIYFKKYGLNSKIARCFAFVGPYLPLDAHFAIGNFIDNVLNNNRIYVNGDGSPYRSYLYASDLAIWLWTILFKGEPMQIYNVGSNEDITIKELAQKVAAYSPECQVEIAQKEKPETLPNRYVPSIQKAQDELGLSVEICLDEAILKTIQYLENA